jgi:hypothetical protein
MRPDPESLDLYPLPVAGVRMCVGIRWEIPGVAPLAYFTRLRAIEGLAAQPRQGRLRSQSLGVGYLVR